MSYQPHRPYLAPKPPRQQQCAKPIIGFSLGALALNYSLTVNFSHGSGHVPASGSVTYLVEGGIMSYSGTTTNPGSIMVVAAPLAEITVTAHTSDDSSALRASGDSVNTYTLPA